MLSVISVYGLALVRVFGEANAAVQPGQPQGFPAKLPLLFATPIKPLKNATLFQGEFDGTMTYRPATVRGASGQSFQSVDEALNPALEFLREHFGDLPVEFFQLRPAMKRDTGYDPHGYSLVLYLGVRYNKIVLQGFGATIYFRRGSIVKASVRVATFDAMPDSEPVLISRDAAFLTLKDKVPDDWMTSIKPDDLELVYAHFPPDDTKLSADLRERGVIVISPNWRVVTSPLMIHIVRGQLWRYG